MPAPPLPIASRLARLALANVRTEYPNKPDHVLGSPADLRSARELHPAFYGSYDWHSSVHMHWTLTRLRRLDPMLPEREEIAAAFDAHFADDAIGAECAYLARPQAGSFERTYGWAWLLELARELAQGEDADAGLQSRHAQHRHGDPVRPLGPVAGGDHPRRVQGTASGGARREDGPASGAVLQRLTRARARGDVHVRARRFDHDRGLRLLPVHDRQDRGGVDRVGEQP